MITAIIDSDHYARASGLWQYDYGQILQIQGLSLPKAVEIHFSLNDKGGESTTRIGITVDNVTSVQIPDSMLENGDTVNNYNIYAFVYLADSDSGETEYRITLPVKARPKPDIPETPEEPELFRNVIESVNQAANAAEQSQKEAEAWAHGREDFPGRTQDNAKYYAEQAGKEAASVPGRVKQGKKDIDEYVRQKEIDLKGETGNVFFTAFKVVKGRLKMYSDPTVDKVRFRRVGSRLKYRLKF